MTHIKEREGAVLTREVVADFEGIVRDTMRKIENDKQHEKLKNALKSLRREEAEE